MSFDDFEEARVINPPPKKINFTDIEKRDILITIIILTLSFTIVLSRGGNLPHENKAVSLLIWLLVSFIYVVFSCMLHEFGHKYAAIKCEAESEYRMFKVGLFVCVITSLIGILFAAPGAVKIRSKKQLSKEQIAFIGAAGPVMNIIVGAITLILTVCLTPYGADNIFYLLIVRMAYLNGFIAMFNLLPIPFLDGWKVFRGNKPAYIVLFALSVFLLFASRFLLNGPLF